MIKTKKATISIDMIVGIVIVIVTFGIIALIFTQVNWSGDADREACSASATFRGTLPSEGLSSQSMDLISLKCKTKLICVTTNSFAKGDCNNIFGKEYSTYIIKESDPEKAKEKIKLLLAREMAECWDMLGRGKFAIFARELTAKNSIGSVAVICSRVHFDKTITGTKKGQLGIKEIQGLNYYLLSHKVPNHEISYWDFLRNAYDGETLAMLSGDMVKDKSGEINALLGETLDISQTKSIFFMEIRPTLAGTLIGGTLGGIAGAVGSIYTRGKGAGFLIGGGIVGGGIVGDWIQMNLFEREGLFTEGTSVAGIFLTDYSVQGFQSAKPELDGETYDLRIASYA